MQCVGGKARAESLSAAERKEIARKAAATRWWLTEREREVWRQFGEGKLVREVEKSLGVRPGSLARVAAQAGIGAKASVNGRPRQCPTAQAYRNLAGRFSFSS